MVYYTLLLRSEMCALSLSLSSLSLSTLYPLYDELFLRLMDADFVFGGSGGVSSLISVSPLIKLVSSSFSTFFACFPLTGAFESHLSIDIAFICGGQLLYILGFAIPGALQHCFPFFSGLTSSSFFSFFSLHFSIYNILHHYHRCYSDICLMVVPLSLM